MACEVWEVWMWLRFAGKCGVYGARVCGTEANRLGSAVKVTKG